VTLYNRIIRLIPANYKTEKFYGDDAVAIRYKITAAAEACVAEAAEAREAKDYTAEEKATNAVLQYRNSAEKIEISSVVYQFSDNLGTPVPEAGMLDLSYEVRCYLIAQIFDQVHRLHSFSKRGQRALHGDLKHGNILLIKDKKEKWRANIIDFGGVTFLEEDSKVRLPPIRTDDFAAPEIGTSFTEKSDIYSLSFVVESLLLGLLPPDADNLATFNLNRMHDGIVQRMQDEDPDKRPTTKECLAFFLKLSHFPVLPQGEQATMLAFATKTPTPEEIIRIIEKNCKFKQALTQTNITSSCLSDDEIKLLTSIRVSKDDINKLLKEFTAAAGGKEALFQDTLMREIFDIRGEYDDDDDNESLKTQLCQHLAANFHATSSINVQGHEGKTALMLASGKGQSDVVQSLIDAGADLNTKDIYSYTALMIAAENGKYDVVTVLLKEDGARTSADLNAQSQAGNTALMLAVQGGHTKIVQDLINANAARTVTDSSAYLNTQNKVGITALMLAVQGGHTAIVADLIAAGADFNTTDIYRYTALMIAAENGKYDVVKVLLKDGASTSAYLDAQSQAGNTALMLAVQGDHTAIVADLIAAGADFNTKNKDGSTALVLAASKGHTEIVQLIILQHINNCTNDNYATLHEVFTTLKSANTCCNRFFCCTASAKKISRLKSTLRDLGLKTAYDSKDSFIEALRAVKDLTEPPAASDVTAASPGRRD
jgi:ankyrin repeat protein